MSGFFDEPPQQPRRPAAAPAQSGQPRSRALVLTAVILVAGFFLASVFTGIWTDRLWFRSLGYSEVFNTVLGTRVLLFLVFGVLMGVVVGLNITLQSYVDRIFFGVMSTPQQCPDLETLLDYMREELDTLAAAAEAAKESAKESADEPTAKPAAKPAGGSTAKSNVKPIRKQVATA